MNCKTITFVLGLIATLSYFADTSVADLVAHYRFNGNANDSSGNSLHGTVNGATLTADRFGVADRAYNFNGSGDHILVPDSPIFAFDQDPYSYSFWFNLNDDTTYQPFLGQWGSSSAERATIVTYNVSNSGVVRVHEENGTSNFTDVAVPIPTAGWHLLTLVRESAGPSKLYLDAVFLGTMNNRETILDATSDFFIGKDPNIPESFGGQIDDVRVYDNALSESEIQDLFTRPDSMILGDANLDGVVNLLDVAPFINLLSTGDFQAEADVNQDGVINLLDVAPFILILSGG